MQILTNFAMPLAILSKCLLPSVLAAPTPGPQAIALNVVDDKLSEPSKMTESSSSLRIRQCLPSLASGDTMQQGEVDANLDSLSVAQHRPRDEDEQDCAKMMESRQAIHGAVEVEGPMSDVFEVDGEKGNGEKKKEKGKRQVTGLDLGTTDGM